MKCRVCQCTYERACANSCGWAPGEGDLCTNCAAVVEGILRYREVAYRFSWAAIRREMREADARVELGIRPKRRKS